MTRSTGLPRRHPLQLRRPQGPARREPSRRLDCSAPMAACPACLLPELTRAGLFDALRRRHHYGDDRLPPGARCRAPVFDAQPSSSTTTRAWARRHRMPVREAMMGDILRSAEREVNLAVEVLGSAPIERIELRNGLDVLETCRPYATPRLSRRLRVIWEGAGISRARPADDLGRLRRRFAATRSSEAAPINLWNLDKRLSRPGWRLSRMGGADHRQFRRLRR